MTTSTTETQETTQSTAAATEKPEPPTKASARAQKPRVAPSKDKASKKTTSAKKTAKAPRKAKLAKGDGARDGSKTAKILDLLKRPGGATTKELMRTTGWQPHSLRGFLSGTVGKKMGLAVTSAKGDDGERSYSVKG
jgi:hypothetical protein